MHDKEIQYFSEGINLAKDEFYLDSINKFKMLIDEYPQSDLADDAFYNIGLCYFNMKQFDQAIETFNQVITNYPDATISALENGNEYGKTVAKTYYSMINCYLLSNNIKEAEKVIKLLKGYHVNTFIIIENKKMTYDELARISIEKYNNLTKK